MTISVREDRGVTVVVVEGHLDAAHGPELGDAVERLWTAGRRRFVVDLAAVGFIDSAGLSTMVRILKRVRGSGELALCGLQGHVRHVFELTRLDRAFDIDGDSGDAVQRLATS